MAKSHDSNADAPPSKLHSVLIENIKSLMVARGENPTSLALKAGLNHRAVHDILQGRSLHPRADTLRALSVALAAQPDALLMAGMGGRNFGTAGLGNTGKGSGAVAAAYRSNAPRIIDGVAGFAAPACLANILPPKAEGILIEIPSPGFGDMAPANAWAILDINAKDCATPGLYWLNHQGRIVLAKLSPQFGDQTTGDIILTLADGSSQTVDSKGLKIRGRIAAVLQTL